LSNNSFKQSFAVAALVFVPQLHFKRNFLCKRLLLTNLFQNGFGVFGITLVPQMRNENE